MYKQLLNGCIQRLSDGAEIPADPLNVDYRAVLAWVEAGNAIEPVDFPTQDELVAANIAAIQSELDCQAQAKGYDNIVSACSYAAGAEGDPFGAEGRAFLAWRSAVWSHAYAVLAEVESGTRAMPTPEEAVAMMPALVLP